MKALKAHKPVPKKTLNDLQCLDYEEFFTSISRPNDLQTHLPEEQYNPMGRMLTAILG